MSQLATVASLDADVRAAVGSVDDPEYPGLSIVDLGLLESVAIGPDGHVAIQLVPTFTGCPALKMIAADVTEAVRAVDGVTDASIEWLLSPAWSTDRVTEVGRVALAKQFTVGLQIGRTTPTCPRCGSPVVETSMFGPSRCRAVARCETCSETVEVMRS